MKTKSVLLMSVLAFSVSFAQSIKAAKEVSIYTTAKNQTEQFVLSKGVFQKFPQPTERDVCVFVDPDFKYQKVLGIGGAITDASAETFYKLPQNKQQELLEAYFGKSGLQYNLVRTNMNSCDFSSDSYTYIQENDKDLKTFNLQHDEKFKIPLIKAAKKAIGKDFKFYFSPWSPPAWMKDNNDMLHGGKLKKEYYQSWANYYIKFIKEYEKRGINVWGLTVQNEPMAVQTWESCIYTADEEAEFLGKYLGPTLHKNGFQDKKVIIWDHNRDLIFQRATTTLNNPLANKYANGIGFHWYETWTKSQPMFNNIAETKKAFADKFLIFTEGCIENFKLEQIHEWRLGEFYGKNMINDFNNGLSAWTDWNILLDETGGPNHVGNFCFAPIIADTRTGELHYTPEYYYIGHFSKYVKLNARRLGTVTNRDYLLSTSFVNPNGEKVIVVMNSSDKEVQYNLWIEEQSVSITAPANSIQSIVI